MTESRFTQVLAVLADQARPAEVPDSTWRRGVRRQRFRDAGAALAVAAVIAIVVVLFAPGGRPELAPGAPTRPMVPSVVYPPLTGEDTIVEAPPGPAAILVAGDNSLRGSDIWGWEGRSLLVGQNGRYRLVRTVGEATAGYGSLVLSPDGRFLAGQSGLEGVRRPDDEVFGTAVFDLTTGKTSWYAGGAPVVWSPDGSAILVAEVDDSRFALRLLDLRTGQARMLLAAAGRTREGNFAAFSPDGNWLAVATYDTLYAIDLASSAVRKLAALTPGDRLAGPGAWLPDGRRLAVYSIEGDPNRLDRRKFRMRYLDASTGQPAPGPSLAPAPGLAVRLLGWQHDGAAVVAVYAKEKGDDPVESETDYWAVGGVELKRFEDGGGQRVLVRLPGDAGSVDVPAALLDQFGGPAPSWPEGAARRLLAMSWPLGQVVEGFMVAVVVAIVVQRVRRRLRSGR